MYFNKDKNQWILAGMDTPRCGEDLRDFLLYDDVLTILAGTIMVFTWNDKPYLMFQTLQELDLCSARNTTLLYYEKGSIVFLGGDGEFVPTLRFRDCRFPTEIELRRYERRATI